MTALPIAAPAVYAKLPAIFNTEGIAGCPFDSGTYTDGFGHTFSTGTGAVAGEAKIGAGGAAGGGIGCGIGVLVLSID